MMRHYSLSLANSGSNRQDRDDREHNFSQFLNHDLSSFRTIGNTAEMSPEGQQLTSDP